MTENRVLVEITRVFKPNSGLYYTQVGRCKCKCGANSHKHGVNTTQCNLRTFGDAQRLQQDPFTIVEECSRLRRRCNNELDVEVVEDQRPLVWNVMDSIQPISTFLVGEEDSNDSPGGGDLGRELCEATSDTDKEEEDVAINLPQQAILDHDQLLQYQQDDEDPSSTSGDAVANTDEGIDEFPERLAECDNVFAAASSRQVAFALESQSIVRQIIMDANELATSQNNQDGNMTATTQHNKLAAEHPLVLGDAFHFMDRVKVPVHHDWKAAYFLAF